MRAILTVRRLVCAGRFGACYSRAAACPASYFEPLCVLRAALGSKDTAMRSMAPSLVKLDFCHPYGSPRGNTRQASQSCLSQISKLMSGRELSDVFIASHLLLISKDAFLNVFDSCCSNPAGRRKEHVY